MFPNAKRYEMTRPTIDNDTFRALQDTAGSEFVNELVQAFFEEAPAMFAEMRASLAARDADRFRRAAHSLKSNSNTFGAHDLGAMAKELELGGLQHALETQPEPLTALAEEYSRVVARLEELCRG